MGYQLGKSSKSTILRLYQALCIGISVLPGLVCPAKQGSLLTLPNNQNFPLAFNIAFFLFLPIIFLCFLCLYLPAVDASVLCCFPETRPVVDLYFLPPRCNGSRFYDLKRILASVSESCWSKQHLLYFMMQVMRIHFWLVYHGL